MLINSKATIKFERDNLNLEVVIESNDDGLIHVDTCPSAKDFADYVFNTFSRLDMLLNNKE